MQLIARKAALAYITGGHFLQAQDMLDGCNPTEAATQYLLFLVAVEQKRETGGTRFGQSKFEGDADPSAINAIKAILECPDVSSQILQLMASLALDKAGDTVVQHAVRGMMEFLVMAGDEGLRKAVLPVSR
jgi:hypothetical protein